MRQTAVRDAPLCWSLGFGGQRVRRRQPCTVRPVCRPLAASTRWRKPSRCAHRSDRVREGDFRLLGRIVDSRAHAFELVQLPLDAHGARRAGHPPMASSIAEPITNSAGSLVSAIPVLQEAECGRGRIASCGLGWRRSQSRRPQQSPPGRWGRNSAWSRVQQWRSDCPSTCP